MPRVQLHEDAFTRTVADGGRDADAGREENAQTATYFLNIAGLDDAPVNGTCEALPQEGGVVGEVEVGVSHATAVVCLANFWIDGKRQTLVDGVGRRQFPVATRPDGGSRHDVDLEWMPRFVFLTGLGGNGWRNGFGCSSRTETAHANPFAVVDERRCFSGRYFRNIHYLCSFRLQIYEYLFNTTVLLFII